MAFVADCSVVLAWCFKDEATDETGLVLRRARQESICVPSIWPIEVANTIVLGKRKGRIDAAQRDEFLEVLDSIHVVIEHAELGVIMRETMRLAEHHRLTAYDASYLELAMRRSLSLASRDRELVAAARQVGVELIPV